MNASTKRPKLATETDREVFFKHWRIVAALAVFATANFSAGPLFDLGRRDPAWWGVANLTLGIMISQVMLIGFLLALFPAGFVFRFLMAFLLTSTQLILCWMGHFLFGVSNQNGVFGLWLSLVAAVVLAFAIPFAMTRGLVGWKLEAAELGIESTAKFSIGSLIVGTALMALSLKAMQLDSVASISYKLTLVMVCAGVGLSILIPYSLCVLRSKFHWFWLLVFSFGMAGLVAFVCWSSGIESILAPADMIPTTDYGRRGWVIASSFAVTGFGLVLVAFKQAGLKMARSATA
ncbi:MAG: hypothetical protein ACI87E_002643 [Mariniblastus sp.]|jgi:hypothetical protein